MLEQIIQDTQRNGFFVYPAFLSTEDLKKINAFFTEARPEFIEAKVGKDKQRVESVRGDYTFWIDPLNPPSVFVPLLDFLKKLQDELNQNFYLGLKQFECHLASYPAGSFYQKHLDRFSKDSSRSFSFICYLNESWKEEDGGELVLYNDKGEEIKKIFPMPGTLTGFLSEEFPHEVKPSLKERRSFTGWMHTKIIY